MMKTRPGIWSVIEAVIKNGIPHVGERLFENLETDDFIFNVLKSRKLVSLILDFIDSYVKNFKKRNFLKYNTH